MLPHNCGQHSTLPVQGVGPKIVSNLGFPFVTVLQELLLVVHQLFTCVCCILEIGPFYDGIDGTSFLAESTVDTLGHVNIVAGSPPTPILPFLSLNSDGLSWTDCLTELACNAALFTCRRSPPFSLEASSCKTDFASERYIRNF